jgi:hypothetical protein
MDSAVTSEILVAWTVLENALSKVQKSGPTEQYV